MYSDTLKTFATDARGLLLEQVGAQLAYVLATDNAELREAAAAVESVRRRVAAVGRAHLIEEVAYTWFNRLVALRFMDVNGYTPLGIVSAEQDGLLPELLQRAKAGETPVALVPEATRRRVNDLLAGRIPSRNPEQESYRLLLTAACNHFYEQMPFLFEPIGDYTELLMPVDLLSPMGMIPRLRTGLTAADCRPSSGESGVEALGWLYQFYIADKKCEVDKKVSKSKGKVTAMELPAKTALYTPHWIVRFLVENSLGRLWLRSHPHSQVAARMPYYIAPDEDEPSDQVLTVTRPEELRLCDPACGSGHLLTYAFELLSAIYEEEGHPPSQIPRLILQHNLTGLEIDPRSAALAAFALTMQACSRDRGFLRRGVHPAIHLVQPPAIDPAQLRRRPWFAALRQTLEGKPLWEGLEADLAAWEQAAFAGSLLRPRLTPAQIEQLLARIGGAAGLFDAETDEQVRRWLAQQVAPLARSYHVVVANPPYLGTGMDDDLSDFAKRTYPDSKSDLFAMFIERGRELSYNRGYFSMVTMEAWMFLSSYEKLRTKLLRTTTIEAMVYMPYLGKGGTSMGINFGTVATTFQNEFQKDKRGHYSCVRYFETNENGVPHEFPVKNERLARASAADFTKIPGAPVAFWVSDRLRAMFEERTIEDITISDGQNKTGNNDRFVRLHWEANRSSVGRMRKWFFYAKGGVFRRWYGNLDEIVNWSPEARAYYKADRISRIKPEYLWFRRGVTWSLISSAKPSFRILPEDATFDVIGSSVFLKDDKDLNYTLAVLNSRPATELLGIISPTLAFQVRDIRNLPWLISNHRTHIENNVSRLLDISTRDWDSYETSWDFIDLPLLRPEHRQATLAATCAVLAGNRQAQVQEMQRLEEENNRLFINAYSLQDELTPDVPVHEITLTCNAPYRYGPGKSAAEYAQLQQADTVRELLSYGVGCLFGRYALDKPGLILANAGDTLEDFLLKVGKPRAELRLLPDADNVLPLTEDEWFADDLPRQLEQFLQAALGPAHSAENLRFVETALGKPLRRWLLSDFYADHLKRYKKRPIYWLFRSPKGAFQALVYLHRYRPETVSVLRTRYLLPMLEKLRSARATQEQVSISSAAGAAARSEALKRIEKLKALAADVEQYDQTILFPLATQQIRLDLDDGVRANYLKLGAALASIPGLEKEA